MSRMRWYRRLSMSGLVRLPGDSPRTKPKHPPLGMNNRFHRAAIEPLEERTLLAMATWVNDNWHLVADNGAAGVLDAGDIVRNDNDTVSPGTITRTYGVDAFGTVTTGGPPSGSNPALDTIDDAIAATNVGGTVNVLQGTYAEESVAANKANLTLRGATGVATDVVIDPPAGNGITVSANNVTIQDLRVTGGVDGISAANVSGLTLDNVQSDANTAGISLTDLSGITTLTDLTITGNVGGGGSINNATTVNFTGTTGNVRDIIQIGNFLQHFRGLGANGANQAIRLANVANLNVFGDGGDDVFSFFAGGAASLQFDGGAGSDTLYGPNAAAVWNITGVNQGNIAGIVSLFTAIENLTGAPDADTFVFAANGVGVTGLIDGGDGANALDYSALSTPVAVNLGLSTTGMSATLEGAQEVPPQNTAAAGTATVFHYDPASKTFDITVTVTDLEPGLVTGFHIHRAPVGVNGPIIIDFAPGGVPIAPLVPTSTGFTFTTGVNLDNSLLGGRVNEAAFLGGITYVNIHTAAAPGGLIRGQLFSNESTRSPPILGTATGTGGVRNIQDVIGGSANDGLLGGFAANTLTGGGGDDVIVGGPNSDVVSGNAGNDILVWSNGDGMDVLDGNADADTVQVNGSVTAADDFAIGVNGTRVDFDRLSPGPFSLDIGTTETLIVNGIGGNDVFSVNNLSGVADLTAINLHGFAGNDTFNIIPAATVTINAQGHLPHPPATPGDTLNVDTTGTTNPTLVSSTTPTGFEGAYTFDDRSPVNFRQVESVLGVPTVSVGDATAQEGDPVVFTLTLSAPSTLPVTVRVNTTNGTATGDVDYDQIDSFVDVVFAPGETTQTVAVPTFFDRENEPEETFFLNVVQTTNASVADGQGIGTIENVDVNLYAVGADAGGGPHVRVFAGPGAEERFSFFAYAANFTGGVRVAMGDVTADGVPDIITATGPGGGPHVRVFDGRTGNPVPGLIGSFYAYDPNFGGGVFVAAADFNGDGFVDILTGAGGGTHVRVFSGADGSELASFAASPKDSSGVRVATGDINGDGTPDIITGTGAGPLPSMVRVFNGLTAQPIAGPLGTFFPYPSFQGGVYIAAGDVNGDGRDDVITGAGPGGGPHVRAFSGMTGTEIASFFAYNPEFTGGVRVGVGDVNQDGLFDIITGAGPGGGPHVRAFSGAGGAEIASFFAFNPAFTGGVFVAGAAEVAVSVSVPAPPAPSSSLQEVADASAEAPAPSSSLASDLFFSSSEWLDEEHEDCPLADTSVFVNGMEPADVVHLLDDCRSAIPLRRTLWVSV